MCEAVCIRLCATHLPITMFVELDHSAVFIFYSAMCLFPLVQKRFYLLAFWRWGELSARCAKTSNCKKRNSSRKGKRKVGKANCVFSAACCVPALSFLSFSDNVPNAASAFSLSNNTGNNAVHCCSPHPCTYKKLKTDRIFVDQEKLLSSSDSTSREFLSLKVFSSNWLSICLFCMSEESFGVCLVLRGVSAVQASQFSSGLCTQRGANPDVSPLFWGRAQKAQNMEMSPWLELLPFINVDQPDSFRLLQNVTRSWENIHLCHSRSLDALDLHLENYDKKNKLEVCRISP